MCAFDWDLTLAGRPASAVYRWNDVAQLANLPPIAEAVAVARALASRGVDVIVVTGRPRSMESVIAEVAREWRLDARIYCAPFFKSYEVLAWHKAGVLAATGAKVFVGDHESDREAADLAGIDFVHADDVASLAERFQLPALGCADEERHLVAQNFVER